MTNENEQLDFTQISLDDVEEAFKDMPDTEAAKKLVLALSEELQGVEDFKEILNSIAKYTGIVIKLMTR